MTIDQIYPKFKQKYKKALVTGGAGFIGSHICEELVIRGFKVISIDPQEHRLGLSIKAMSEKTKTRSGAKAEAGDKIESTEVKSTVTELEDNKAKEVKPASVKKEHKKKEKALAKAE